MYEIFVKGIVQGVGFRPFVFNEAKKCGLLGYVQNVGGGVVIVCDNKDKVMEILTDLPELAKIDDIEMKNYTGKESFSDFEIRFSDSNKLYSPIPADLNICNECVNEMLDKNNRRYGYFFVSCTNCGPRFSIAKTTPYDRKNTSLDNFTMCDKCLEEYTDTKDRRFHAQTIACPNCGPKLSLYFKGKKINCENPIIKTVELIKKGEIVAIKGVGGFHLVCNFNYDIVQKLKDITKRYHKPFALMAKNVDMAKKYCNVNEIEEEILLSRKRPIVLLEKRYKRDLLWVSEISSLGFMLPYSGLHYLIYEYYDEPLIFTSSNMPSFPITLNKDEQFVAWVLDYNRDISNTVDDSIVKVIEMNPLLIRRSRGYVPNEINITSWFWR